MPAAPRTAKPRRTAEKIDPKYLAAARELRDRYLEHVNADPAALTARAKYHVVRALPSRDRPAPMRIAAALPDASAA